MFLISPCIVAFLAVIAHTEGSFKFWRERKCEEWPFLVCHFAPIGGSGVSGFAELTPLWYHDDYWGRGHCVTHIYAEVRGLTASTKHGWHIHQFGDVSDTAKGTKTGGHYTNPFGRKTRPGLPGDKNRHWGDIGNLPANASGVAVYDRIDKVISRTSVLAGRALVVHAKEDFGRKPGAPSAGARIAQCVIGLEKSSA